ncbi:unnamed protein product [Parascedosporium putredinis]|uniref:Heterokaryon incompatibility domain-containing protein n=1 Tax=Parascedosporium putredinis TaxID=1442378 RepID=A0A9P1H1U8_9PEZI|nr:unnamed protein product [Parascedosporium putredinis]CAI7993044.1 unnamed protein product [Parascedosporium putredinis]
MNLGGSGISRVLSPLSRLGAFISSIIVAGIGGSFLHKLNNLDFHYGSKFTYLITLAGLSIVFSLVLIAPFKFTFWAFPLDFIMFVMWMVAFGLMANLSGNCGGAWYRWIWTFAWRRNRCGTWRALLAFCFLASMFWLFNCLLGLYKSFFGKKTDADYDREHGVGHRHKRFSHGSSVTDPPMSQPRTSQPTSAAYATTNNPTTTTTTTGVTGPTTGVTGPTTGTTGVAVPTHTYDASRDRSAHVGNPVNTHVGNPVNTSSNPGAYPTDTTTHHTGYQAQESPALILTQPIRSGWTPVMQRNQSTATTHLSMFKDDNEEDSEAVPVRRFQWPTASHPDLCARCQSVDWAVMIHMPPTSIVGRHPFSDTAETMRLDELRQSSCPVCRALAVITPEKLDGEMCRFKAFASTHSLAWRYRRLADPKPHTDCSVIFPVHANTWNDKSVAKTVWLEGGCLALVPVAPDGELNVPEIGPRVAELDRIDYSVLRGWIHSCSIYHESACQVNYFTRVPGMRVIDCRTRAIIPAQDGCRYVALSYVWGSPPSTATAAPANDASSGTPPASSQSVGYSAVVEDAIAVSLELGYKYIWVDQYCIDQKDEVSKAQQIAQMDNIYSLAQLTIVAAAGEDASYGLPGVGPTRARSQRQSVVKLGDVALVQIFPTSSTTSRARGGPRAVAYVCNTMHCSETITRPMNLTKTEKLSANEAFFRFIPSHQSFSSRRNQMHRWELLKQQHLPGFTDRNLTHGSDSLNAILGIFRSMEKSGIYHLHGVPLSNNASRGSQALVLALGWHHEQVSDVRRAEFPSWSWAGWQGCAKVDEPDVRIPEDCLVSLFDDETGQSISVEEWHRGMTARPSRAAMAAVAPPSPILRITGPVFPACFRPFSPLVANQSLSQMSQRAGMSFREAPHVVFPITADVTLLVLAHLDESIASPPENETDVVVLLMRPKFPMGATSMTGLLLKPVPQGRTMTQRYRRIGILRIRHRNRSLPTGPMSPQTVYVDGEGNLIDEVDVAGEVPIWIRDVAVKTVDIV